MKQMGVVAFEKPFFGKEQEAIQAELEVVEKEGDNAPTKYKSVKDERRAIANTFIKQNRIGTRKISRAL